MSGQIPRRYTITNITNGNPCSITLSEDHEFSTGAMVRLTELNGSVPVPFGMDPINNYRFEVVVTGDKTFYIRNPITHENVDSTDFTPYSYGGSCNLIEQNFIYYNDDQNSGE